MTTRDDMLRELAGILDVYGSFTVLSALKDAAKACQDVAGQDQRRLWARTVANLSGAADDVFRAEAGASTTLDMGCSRESRDAAWAWLLRVHNVGLHDHVSAPHRHMVDGFAAGYEEATAERDRLNLEVEVYRKACQAIMRAQEIDWTSPDDIMVANAYAEAIRLARAALALGAAK